MRLMVVGPDIRDLRKVKNFTGVQAYYIARELTKRGVELRFVEHKPEHPLEYFKSVSGAGCDHVLALSLRYFTHNPVGCATILRAKVPGAVTHMHDGLIHEHLDAHMHGVDCTFTFRDDSTRTPHWERYAKNYCHIGWASDPQVLYPEQKSDELRIMIDHPYYKDGQPDLTEWVTTDAVAFAKSDLWRSRYKSVRVKRLINGGAEDVYQHDTMLKKFDRKHIPFVDIAPEYRRTHVYLPTHKESVGLTCLELAYCGALVVTPAAMIYPDRLETVRHIEYADSPPWPDVLTHINIKASAEKARLQSWDKVADRMLHWFRAFHR